MQGKAQSVTLREVFRLRVLENRMLRKIFGPKRDEIKGNWREMHNEALHDLYCSPNIVRVIKSRRVRRLGNVARMGKPQCAYRVSMGKYEVNSPLGKPR